MACAGPSRHPPPLPLVPHAPASSGLGRSSVFCAREEHKEPCDNLKDIRAHFYDYRNDEGILRQSEFHEVCGPSCVRVLSGTPSAGGFGCILFRKSQCNRRRFAHNYDSAGPRTPTTPPPPPPGASANS